MPLDPALAPWLNFGAAGAVVIALAVGIFVTRGHADEIRAQRNEAMAGWKSQTDATKELAGVVRDQTTKIGELTFQIAELGRREGRGGS